MRILKISHCRQLKSLWDLSTLCADSGIKVLAGNRLACWIACSVLARPACGKIHTCVRKTRDLDLLAVIHYSDSFFGLLPLVVCRPFCTFLLHSKRYQVIFTVAIGALRKEPVRLVDVVGKSCWSGWLFL